MGKCHRMAGLAFFVLGLLWWAGCDPASAGCWKTTGTSAVSRDWCCPGGPQTQSACQTGVKVGPEPLCECENDPSVQWCKTTPVFRCWVTQFTTLSLYYECGSQCVPGTQCQPVQTQWGYQQTQFCCTES